MTTKTFEGFTKTVPVGDIYESVSIDEGIVNVGDVIVWEDPDATHHDESILTTLFVGVVEKVYHMNYDHRDVELGTSCPVGRLAIDNHMKVISGEEIYRNIDGASDKFVNQFLNSGYEKYMQIDYTMDGDCEITGE